MVGHVKRLLNMQVAYCNKTCQYYCFQVGNGQGTKNNFRIQAKKQHKKQMAISVVNVTITTYAFAQVYGFPQV